MAARTPKMFYWQDAPVPRNQLVLFTTTLDERIPEDHPVRLLDEILDELDWCEWEAKYDGNMGKPPIHPSVLCKVILYAMTRRIRSSRAMEYAVTHSIDFIWLVSGRSLDHTTISEFRRKHGKELKSIYRQMIFLAVSMGVAKLSELCIDGTKVQANAGRFKTFKRENVAKLIDALDAEISEALATMESNDAVNDLFADDQPDDKLPTELSEIQQRREKLLEVKAQLEQMEEQRRRDGIDNKKNPAQLPVNDVDSRILPNKEGGYAPNYTPMAVTETGCGLVVSEEVLIGNVEHLCVMPMLNEIEEIYATHVETVLADGAFATGSNLAAAEERNTEFLSPVRQEERANNPAYREDLTQPVAEADIPLLPINPRTKRFDREAFVFNAETDTYHCPAGKVLKREGTVEKQVVGGVEVHRMNYRCHECEGCPLAKLCRMTENAKTGRKVGHDEHREVRERQAKRMQDPVVKQRYSRRQHYGETQFAFIKANLGIRRFLLRGLASVQVEWRWACMAHNVTKLMKRIADLRALTTAGAAITG